MNKPLAILAVCMSLVAAAVAAAHQTFLRADAGGHPVRMLEGGRGGPTVLFESGSGGPLESWILIQPKVNQFARTISYDRAGNGQSPRSPLLRDGKNVALELHEALRGAHASPPYILVGHSLGGPYIRVFAGMYPDEIAGMILIDPTQEELIDWSKENNPQPAPREPRPYDEVDCAPVALQQAHDAKLPPEIPIVLISGQGPRKHPSFLTPQQRADLEKDIQKYWPMKQKFHKAWVRQFPRGTLVVTEKSGHGIPFEEPELVVSEIQKMVGEIRSKAGRQ